MKIGEKLSELRTNILRDRSDLIAGDTDSFWSDETLLRYIKDGERRFARQVLCIRDSTTPAVCKVKLKTGVTLYPLHASILGVLSARYNTDTFDLARSGHSILATAMQPEFLEFDPSTNYTVSPGRPLAFSTDETLVYGSTGTVVLNLYPEPAADQDGLFLALRVLRLPLSAYTADTLDDDSEIPEDYELDPLQWAAYRALANTDADAGSSTLAEQHEEAFEKAVRNAQREVRRKIFVNAGFRFGRNGFAWNR